MVKNGMRPIHPGEILLEEFLRPSDPPLNANALAKALSVSRQPNYRHPQRTAWNYRRYGVTTWDVFQYLSWVLDESAEDL